MQKRPGAVFVMLAVAVLLAIIGIWQFHNIGLSGGEHEHEEYGRELGQRRGDDTLPPPMDAALPSLGPERVTSNHTGDRQARPVA